MGSLAAFPEIAMAPSQIECKFRAGENSLMMDLSRDIQSLSNFKRNTSEFVAQLKGDRTSPSYLRSTERRELVVQNAASYQKFIELAERSERLDNMAVLRASVDEMKAGKGIPADDVLAEMRSILTSLKRRR